MALDAENLYDFAMLPSATSPFAVSSPAATSPRYSDALSAKVVVAGHFDLHETYKTRRIQGTDDWLLVLTLSGRGYVRAEAGERKLGPGDLVLFEPFAYHDYGVEAGGRWELL